MITQKDGGPAFPVRSRIAVSGINPADGTEMPVEIEHQFDGMTLRDYFAANAMAGWDARVAALFSYAWASRIAYSHADAMLATREPSTPRT